MSSQPILESKEERLNDLLAICKEKQGPYLPYGHGSGSWATTYSHEFIKAAKEILGLLDGSPQWKVIHLAMLFQESGIRSCRGGAMDVNRTHYLYERHLKPKDVTSEPSLG